MEKRFLDWLEDRMTDYLLRLQIWRTHNRR